MATPIRDRPGHRRLTPPPTMLSRTTPARSWLSLLSAQTPAPRHGADFCPQDGRGVFHRPTSDAFARPARLSGPSSSDGTAEKGTQTCSQRPPSAWPTSLRPLDSCPPQKSPARCLLQRPRSSAGYSFSSQFRDVKACPSFYSACQHIMHLCAHLRLEV